LHKLRNHELKGLVSRCHQLPRCLRGSFREETPKKIGAFSITSSNHFLVHFPYAHLQSSE